MRCSCQIVSADVLRRFHEDRQLPQVVRDAMADTLRLDEVFRRIRTETTELSRVALSIAPLVAISSAPQVIVYDCNHSQALPGVVVSSPSASTDAPVKNAFTETEQVAEFYKQLFGRNSIDNAGMTLVSSVHYGHGYNNAFWNGSQMTYGDGDGQIFTDFTRGEDVIAHELTHGVTQHSLQLNYQDESGGLNESISDCFGAMFKQWRRGQEVDQADWLIGADILGPAAISRGLTCLRDMANPAATHCLSPQPTNFSQYQHGMDPHISSGIANKAFCSAAVAVGGRSWGKVGRVWYAALTGSGSNPNMGFKDFATRTRGLCGQLFSGDGTLADAVDQAWRAVGL